jgi:Ca2+-binding EF-hand superfamily protein
MKLKLAIDALNILPEQLFKRMDKDANSTVDYKEFESVLRDPCYNFEHVEIDLIFSYFDGNSDGKVKLAIFVSKLEQVGLINDFKK